MLTTADKIGLGILGVGVVGGGAYLVLSNRSASVQTGKQAPPNGPAQVTGTSGGGSGNFLGDALGFVQTGVQLWGEVKSIWNS